MRRHLQIVRRRKKQQKREDGDALFLSPRPCGVCFSGGVDTRGIFARRLVASQSVLATD